MTTSVVRILGREAALCSYPLKVRAVETDERGILRRMAKSFGRSLKYKNRPQI